MLHKTVKRDISMIQNDNKNALKCTEHVVAFVDLLGCSNSIRNNSIEMLNQIRDLYIEAKDMCHQGPMAENCSKLKIKIFSDNILFAYETGRKVVQRRMLLDQSVY